MLTEVKEQSVEFVMFPLGNGQGEGGGIQGKTLGLLGEAGEVCFFLGQNGAHVNDGVDLVVENCEGQGGISTGGINPVICIIVGEGFGGGPWGVRGDWGGGVSEYMCDMSCGGLENQGGLGFSKETRGKVVKGTSPGDHHIGGTGRVQG